eukprot:6479747-Amphidinium_carterae.1
MRSIRLWGLGIRMLRALTGARFAVLWTAVDGCGAHSHPNTGRLHYNTTYTHRDRGNVKLAHRIFRERSRSVVPIHGKSKTCISVQSQRKLRGQNYRGGKNDHTNKARSNWRLRLEYLPATGRMYVGNHGKDIP